ncbi:hypothetical protein CHUAL_002666 [Chamberlinius hualienensis]
MIYRCSNSCKLLHCKVDLLLKNAIYIKILLLKMLNICKNINVNVLSRLRIDSTYITSILTNYSSTKMAKPVETAILKKISEELNPTHLELINESYMHNVPKGSESHFKLLVVSSSFDNQPLIKAKTPEQWEKAIAEGQSPVLTKSPPCLGGFGK